MPFSPGDFYHDVPASNIAVRRFQRASNFLAAQMCPRMIVTKPSGIFYKWKMGDLNRDEVQERAYTAPARVGTFGKEDDTFKVSLKSLAYDLNDTERKASDVQINPETMIPRALAYKILISSERMLAAAFFIDSAWFRVVTGVSGAATRNRKAATGQITKFSDTTIDPLPPLLEEIQDQALLTGFRPTGMALGVDAALALRTHPAIRATLTLGSVPITRTQPATGQELANLLGLQWVGWSEAIYNTKLENEAPSNNYIVAPDEALIFFRTGGDDQNAEMYNNDEPAALARVVWADGAGNDQGIRIRRFRDEKAGAGGSDHSEIDAFHQYKVVTKEMGTRLKSLV